jgi:hypothetical protein
LYGAFTGLFDGLEEWRGWLLGDWNPLAYLAALVYGPVPAGDANVVASISARVLGDMSINPIWRALYEEYCAAQQPGHAAATDAAAHAATAADEAEGRVWE